jgi:hypothetical protein
MEKNTENYLLTWVYYSRWRRVQRTICSPGYIIADGEEYRELYEELLDLLLLCKERPGDGHVALHRD